VEAEQNVTIACTVTSEPQPSITWSKAFDNFPKGRTEVMDGNLAVYNVTKKERVIFICKAKNILGSTEETALLIVLLRLRFKVRPPQEVTPRIGSTIRLQCVAENDLRTTVTWAKDGRPLLPVDSYVPQSGTLVLENTKKSHEGSYTCRATNALTTVETKVKINSPVTAASCSVIRKYVSSVSANYVIDPDGEGGLVPFTVFCDMTDKNGVGVTVVRQSRQ